MTLTREINANGAIPVFSKYAPVQRAIQTQAINNDGFSPLYRDAKQLTPTSNPGHNVSLHRWIRDVVDETPPYRPDSRVRDLWLQAWRYKESHIASAINQICQLYANRGWILVGGRNQVRKFVDRLHDSAWGKGWRYMTKTAALSFLTTDMCSVLEVQREQDVSYTVDGDVAIAPLLRLNPIDPARCRLLKQASPLPGRADTYWWSTLNYNGHYLFDWDYLRTASMPTDMDGYLGLGFCALSRAIEVVKLLNYLVRHDQEEMDSEMPDGLLLLTNITEHQWKSAMKFRKEELTAKERKRYGGLEVLAGGGQFGAADAKLLALSQIPLGMDRKDYIDSCMYAVAAAFGFDPAEIWPINAGVLGRGNETKIQHEKTMAKGVEDFPLSLQESIQREMPDTIHYEMEERDEQGELALLENQKLAAETIRIMANTSVSGSSGGETPPQLAEFVQRALWWKAMRRAIGDEGDEDDITNPLDLPPPAPKEPPVLSREEIRMLWADKGLIPTEWTEQEEDMLATDEAVLRHTRQRVMDMPAVRRSCEVHWDEPVIIHRYRGVRGDTEQMLWESGHDAMKRQTWQLNRYMYRDNTVHIPTRLMEDKLKVNKRD